MFNLLMEIAGVLCGYRNLWSLLEKVGPRVRKIAQFATQRTVAQVLTDEFALAAGLPREDGKVISWLLHWRVLAHLISKLDLAHQQSIRQANTDCTTNPSEMSVWVVDSHLHLDKLWKQHGQVPVSTILENTVRRWNKDLQFIGVVAVFAYPPMWPKGDDWDFLRDQPVRVAMGIHPRRAGDAIPESEWEYLEECAASGRVAAIGEVGMDLSSPTGPWERERQVEVLTRTAEMAHRFRLPLVVHARDAGDETMKVLQTIVRSSHPIHVHCFSGSFRECRRWLQIFPEARFGFTSRVLRGGMERVLSSLELGQILLESDAPYLGSPWSIGAVASYIGRVKNTPTDVVANATTRNVHQLYC